jgi:hypothetical protein
MPGTKYDRGYASGSALNTVIASRTSFACDALGLAGADLTGEEGADTGATGPPHAAHATTDGSKKTRTPK